MDTAKTLDQGLDFFAGVLRQVKTDQWHNATPCAEWDVRNLVGHVVGVMQLAVRMCRGGDLGGSLSPAVLGDDPVADWDRAASQVRDELASADLNAERDTALGRKTVAFSLSFPTFDLYLHGWDLGAAIGKEVHIPADVAEWIDGFLRELPEKGLRSPKTFGPEQPCPPDADATTRLMAFTGRTV